MTYQKTLAYLFEQLPMFHRIGAAAYKADLNNTNAIIALLNQPQKKFKSIHVAGTNGKGSSSHMLAACFQNAGYKTGLYTSPHLKDFRERIRINGKMISKKYVVDFVKKHKVSFEKIQPSFFEWTVGLAFDYFANQKVDIAIIEVGLGGRLDSTNVLQPIASLITNISLDHTALLGNTKKEIALEKAGIIKSNSPLVVSQYQKEVAQIFKNRAKKLKTTISFASAEMELISYAHTNHFLFCSYLNNKKSIENYKLDLTGKYQLKNLPGVIKTLEIAKRKGYKKLSEKKTLNALSQVKKITGLKGRWQTLASNPLTIADTGHNEDGIKEVLDNLNHYQFNKLHFVLGMVNDKDVNGILALLPKNAIYYFTKASIPRSLPEKELAKKAIKYNLKGKSYPNVQTALKEARNKANANDLILIGGSNFIVADAIE